MLRKAIDPPTQTGWVIQVNAEATAAAGRPNASRTHRYTPPSPTKALPVSDVLGLLDSVGGDDPGGLRDRALLELLYSSGARISEAVGLDVDDLDASECTVRLDGEIVRSAYELHAEDDDFGQAGTLVREVFDDAQRYRLVDTVVGALSGVVEPVLSQALQYWSNIDGNVGSRIAEGVKAAAESPTDPGEILRGQETNARSGANA